MRGMPHQLNMANWPLDALFFIGFLFGTGVRVSGKIILVFANHFSACQFRSANPFECLATKVRFPGPVWGIATPYLLSPEFWIETARSPWRVWVLYGYLHKLPILTRSNHGDSVAAAIFPAPRCHEVIAEKSKCILLNYRSVRYQRYEAYFGWCKRWYTKRYVSVENATCNVHVQSRSCRKQHLCMHSAHCI